MPHNSNHPCFSVIIPSFNCERYLAQCLESVSSQDLSEIEIIIVDDCSTDGSADLAAVLATQDQRITVFRQEINQGVSVARNVALDHARGEFVCFLDADDYWIDTSMLSCFYEQLKSDKSDFLRFGIRKLDLDGDVTYVSVDRIDAVIDLYKRYDWKVSYTSTTHVFRRNLLEELHLRFMPGLSMGEDALFNTKFYCHAKRLTTSARVCYEYRYNQSGANQSRWDSRHLESEIVWFEHAIDVIKSSPAYLFRPDLLQDLYLERIDNLLRRFGRIAVNVLDDAYLTNYMGRWSMCFSELNSLDKLSEVQRRFLEMLKNNSASDIRTFFDKGTGQKASIALNRQQAEKLGKLLLSLNDMHITVDLGAGWKLSLPRSEAHDLARRLLSMKGNRFDLELL